MHAIHECSDIRSQILIVSQLLNTDEVCSAPAVTSYIPTELIIVVYEPMPTQLLFGLFSLPLVIYL